MSEKMKPCPFCGGKASIKIHDFFDDTRLYTPKCKCGASIVEVFHTEAEAIEAWNTRYERWTCTMEKKKSGYLTGLICSKCGCTSFYMYDDPGEHGMFIGLPFPEYCYNCGAKVVER